jgi:hypothetical protein
LLIVIETISTRYMLKSTICSLLFFFILTSFPAQIIKDDFEGNVTITSWFGDDCGIATNLNNLQPDTSNSSNKVLIYCDIGGKLMRTSNSVVPNNEIKINQPGDLINRLYFISFELNVQLQFARLVK